MSQIQKLENEHTDEIAKHDLKHEETVKEHEHVLHNEILALKEANA